MEPEQTELEVETPEVESTEVVEKTMEDTARETYREIMARNAEPETSPEGEAEAPEPTAQRARGPDGKFVKQDGIPDAPAATPEQTQAPAEQQQAQPAQAATNNPDQYPRTWRKGLENDWKALPAAVRQEIAKREQDMDRGLAQYREPAAFGQAIGQEMLPHIDVMREIGVTPQRLTRDLMGAWVTLVKGSPDEKRNMLLQLAQGAGIDIAGSAPQATASQQPDTAVQPVLEPVLQRVQNIEQMVRQQAQEQARAASESAAAEVAAFRAKPEHKHFDAVQQTMAQLVSTGQATTLDDAYSKAIWMVPEVREQLLAEQAQKRAADEAAKAAAARKAAAVNVPRRGTAPVAPKTGSMEDTIRETLRRLNSQ